MTIRMETTEQCYFSYISEMTGMQIEGEYQMISMLRSLSRMKKKNTSVWKMPWQLWNRRVWSGHAGAFGYSDGRSGADPACRKIWREMRAISPSIHMIKADIETEIAPIVGSEEQANDLIAYIREGRRARKESGRQIFSENRSGELMEDGIRSKILQMDDECQLKLQDTMQKIVNDSNGGMICIII